MERIAIFEKYWDRPTKADFENYNAHILLDRLLIYNVLKPNGTLSMIHSYHFEDIAIRYGINTGYKEFMYQYINDLPEKVWQQALKELNFK